jgi:hypothetical protein
LRLSKISQSFCHEQHITHVRFPSSVVSKDSCISSFISAVNISPFVSRAHLSSSWGEMYASDGGIKKTPGPVPTTEGVQYLAKMCLRHRSSCQWVIRQLSSVRRPVNVPHTISLLQNPRALMWSRFLTLQYHERECAGNVKKSLSDYHSRKESYMI